MVDVLRGLIEALFAFLRRDPAGPPPSPPISPAPPAPPSVPPAVPPSPPPSIATGQRDAFVACAQRQVGKRYVWATAGPETFDCSGLVAYCYEEATGKQITRSSDEQLRLGEAVTGHGEPGDLLFWDTERNGTAGHVGILEEGQTVINALNEERGVIRSAISASYGGPYLGARRLPFDRSSTSRPPVTAQTRWRDAGAVDRDRVREILAAYPLGAEAEAIYDAVQGRALPIAQAWLESRYGQDANAQATHNPLGLMQSDGSTLMTFSTWANAFREWARRMDDPTYKSGVYARNASLEEFISIYVGGPMCWATRGAECANGESWESTHQYLDETVARLNRYFHTEAATTAKANRNSFRKPRIYDVRDPADAAKFGLTAGEVRALLSFSFGPRDMSNLWGVLHTQSGNTPGSLDWWLHGFTAGGQQVQASANYMAQRDGSLLRVIPEQEGPWTNGDVKHPTVESAALRAAGGNPNTHSLTCEAEGDWNEPFTPGQLQAILWLFAEWMLTYGFGLERVLPHSSINSVDRAHCPGGEHMQAVRDGLRKAGFK